MMKRSTKLALSLVLAVGAAVPALAQDNFPDVPANHWAFDALVKMKADGVLVGYPDGLFRGARPASRYELAVALNAAYSHLKSLIDGMQTQLDALKAATAQDIQNLKDQIAHLQDEINAMKGWGDDIAALKKASEEFDKELRALGVDVEAMKKDLGDLQERVSRLEKKKPPVDISGDINFFAVSTNSGDGHTLGLTTDGVLEGYNGGSGPAHSGAATTGLFKDLTFIHEGAFTVAGTNETGPKWKGTFVVGNAIGTGGFGTQSTFNPGGAVTPWSEGKEDVYIQDLSVKTDISVLGQTFSAEGGRVAYKLSPYMFQRPITESYYVNERWDDGKYRFDGAILGFNFGAAKLHVWGGNTSNLLSVNGIDLNPLEITNNRSILGTYESPYGTNGASTGGASGIVGQIDKEAAADLGFNLGSHGHVSLGYLLLEQEGSISSTTTESAVSKTDNLLNSASSGSGANRDNVFGGDADFGFGRFKIGGGFHLSTLTDNEKDINSKNNQAWNATVKYSADKFNIYGGYRTIDKDYFAPGDWGRLGIVQNPAGLEGWQAGGSIDLTKVIRVTAEGEWDKGLGSLASSQGGGLNASPYDSSTNIRQLMARVDFRLNPNLSVFGSFQDVKYSGLVAGGTFLGGTNGSPNALIDWTTVGLGYGLSANAKFTLQYQFSNGGDSDAGSGVPTKINGGILTSQLTIKF